MKKLFFVLTAGLVLSGLVYGKQEKWASVSFDMVISRSGIPKTTTKMYMGNSGDNIRMETIEHDGQGNTRKAITIILGDKNIMYVYYPDENTAMKMKLDPTKSPVPTLPKPQGKKIRTEKIDGKLRDIYEYTEKDFGTPTKVWIWREKELPVKL